MLEGVRRPPLGIEPLPAVEATLQLNPGDALVLFSDGLAKSLLPPVMAIGTAWIGSRHRSSRTMQIPR